MPSLELPGLGLAYGKDNSNVQLISMSWIYEDDYMVDYIRLRMGSVKINNFGLEESLLGHSGDGTPFDVTLCINGNPDFSATCKITNIITNIELQPTGLYSPQNEWYEFKFKSSPVYSKGDILNIVWANRNELTDSTELGQILTIGSGVYIYRKAPIYTVTWYQNYYEGDAAVIKTMEVKPDETVIDIPTPTRSGYTFIGWKLENGDDPDKALESVKSNLSIYAQWEKQSAYIWKYDKSKGWEKVLNVKKYTNGAWSDLSNVHQKNHNGWA